jgi:hypothetical protein
VKSLARLTVAAANLAEAEGRALRENVVTVAVSVGLVLGATVLGLAGLGYLLWALYRVLLEPVGEPLAALITGVVAVVIAGALLWVAKSQAARDKSKDATEDERQEHDLPSRNGMSRRAPEMTSAR